MKYIFNKNLFTMAIRPYTVKDVLLDIRLTPSQMINFFVVEPNVEKLLKLRTMFPTISFLDCLVPSLPKTIEEPQKNVGVQENEVISS